MSKMIAQQASAIQLRKVNPSPTEKPAGGAGVGAISPPALEKRPSAGTLMQHGAAPSAEVAAALLEKVDEDSDLEDLLEEGEAEALSALASAVNTPSLSDRAAIAARINELREQMHGAARRRAFEEQRSMQGQIAELERRCVALTMKDTVPVVTRAPSSVVPASTSAALPPATTSGAASAGVAVRAEPSSSAGPKLGLGPGANPPAVALRPAVPAPARAGPSVTPGPVSAPLVALRPVAHAEPRPNAGGPGRQVGGTERKAPAFPTIGAAAAIGAKVGTIKLGATTVKGELCLPNAARTARG